MRSRAALVAVVVAGLCWPVAAAARDHPPSIEVCDWSSFRNGPANPGASTCDGIGVPEAASLAPQMLYRTAIR